MEVVIAEERCQVTVLYVHLNFSLNLTNVIGSTQKKSKTIGTEYLMHLALIQCEATGPDLMVAIHETLHTKSSEIELMHNSHPLSCSHAYKIKVRV